MKEALWRKCFIPLSVTIKDAMFGPEWSFLQEHVWVPDTFPYICSTCRGRSVEERGGCSWGEDLRLTTCSASVISPTLMHFSSTQATGFSSRKLRVTHNSWIFNKHLIYTIDIWIRAASSFFIFTVVSMKWKNWILFFLSLWCTSIETIKQPDLFFHFILVLKGRQGLQVKEDNTKSTLKKGLNNDSCA